MGMSRRRFFGVSAKGAALACVAPRMLGSGAAAPARIAKVAPAEVDASALGYMQDLMRAKEVEVMKSIAMGMDRQCWSLPDRGLTV